jgi:argininosuccinate lyase
MVTYSLENNLAPTDLTSDLLTQIAKEKLDIDVELSDELLQQALDPMAFVQARNVFGGSAPSATSAVLGLQFTALNSDKQWLNATYQKLDQANQHLMDEIRDIL